jgi:hypothetical protein
VRPFELSECAHDREQELAHGAILAGECQALLGELHPYSTFRKLEQNAAKVIRLRAMIHDVAYATSPEAF